MFRKSRRSGSNPDSPAPSAPSRTPAPDASHIGNGVTVRGNLEGSGEVVLEGRLEGEMNIRGVVSVGPDGATVGRISAEEIVLKGSVEGEVEASGRLVITASGKLSGGMDAPRLVIEEGGRLQGHCRMTVGAREGAAEFEEKRPLLPSFQEALESR